MIVARRVLAVLLALATAYTVGRVGILHAAAFRMATERLPPHAWTWPTIRLSLWYTVPVLLTLFVHEQGHRVAARYYAIESTGPYLIPLPLAVAGWLPWPVLPAFGTLGAVLRLRHAPETLEGGWDIAWGGLSAGAVVTVGATVLGIAFSPVLGRPAVLAHPWTPWALAGLTTGLVWHPLLSAAWFGWLLIAVSLLPLPGLDGHRLAHGMASAWRRRPRAVLALAALCLFAWL